MAQLSSTQVRDIAFHIASEINAIMSIDALVGRVHEHTLNGVNATELYNALWKPSHEAKQESSVDHALAILTRGTETSGWKGAYSALLAYTANGVLRAHGDTIWFARGVEVTLHLASQIIAEAQRRAVAEGSTCVETSAEELDAVLKLAKSDPSACAMKLQSVIARHTESTLRAAPHVWDRIFAHSTGDRFVALLRTHARDAGYPIVAQLAINVATRMRVLVAALVRLGLVQVAEAVVRGTPNIPIRVPAATSAAALFNGFDEFEFFLACTES
jgi:hypothetical protein